MSLTFDPLLKSHFPVNLQFFCNMIIDDSDSNTVYIGYSVISGAYTDAIWRIKRINKDVNGFTQTLWAGGDSAFTRKFSLRSTYTY